MKIFASGRGRMGAAVAGLAAVVLLVAACGSSGSGNKESPGKSADVVNWAEPPNATPNWIWPFAVTGTNSLINADLIPQMYRTLYAFGNHGNANLDESLSLAQQPSWSADGKTATITLKSGYKWSNGEPVNADGVLFNLNMYKAEKANEANYVPGAIPDNIVSATAPNPSTLIITTDKA
ncbi:MAG: ABC transporter substrate-binding protein, partial [Candidatus Dormibacteraceae bacterium]